MGQLQAGRTVDEKLAQLGIVGLRGGNVGQGDGRLSVADEIIARERASAASLETAGAYQMSVVNSKMNCRWRTSRGV